MMTRECVCDNVVTPLSKKVKQGYHMIRKWSESSTETGNLKLFLYIISHELVLVILVVKSMLKRSNLKVRSQTQLVLLPTLPDYFL